MLKRLLTATWLCWFSCWRSPAAPPRTKLCRSSEHVHCKSRMYKDESGRKFWCMARKQSRERLILKRSSFVCLIQRVVRW